MANAREHWVRGPFLLENEIEPLLVIVELGFRQNNRPTECGGLENRSGAIWIRVDNTQTMVFVHVQGQARTLLKVWDNLELLVVDLEVSYDWAIHAKSIFNVFVDTVRWDIGRAFCVSGDNAELELLEVLVSARKTTNEQVTVDVLGQEGLEVVVPELERVVLPNVRLEDTMVEVECFFSKGCEERTNKRGLLRTRTYYIGTIYSWHKQHSAYKIDLLSCGSYLLMSASRVFWESAIDLHRMNVKGDGKNGSGNVDNRCANRENRIISAYVQTLE